MGKRGPAPLPTKLKLLRGEKRKVRLNPEEPRPAGVPEPPAWLSREARALWDERAPELVRIGVLTAVDGELFGAYCQEFSDYRRLKKLCRKVGDQVAIAQGFNNAMHKALEKASRLGAKFGLTASDRTQIKVPPPAAPNDEEFLFGDRRRTSA